MYSLYVLTDKNILKDKAYFNQTSIRPPAPLKGG
jgi:hypothetical protein